ncbi:hypothetical protein V8J88_03995 [Massilia sp. W12]|uniref:hypothetical protein n=1 Tax=Massilia sp. W12 TaxID=3126507 RepID=UPI0030D5A31E
MVADDFKFTLYNKDSCHIASLADPSLIDQSGLLLQCGDTLKQGDLFTYLGRAVHSKKSAGFATISLNPGWVQRYEGRIKAPLNFLTAEFALFTAWHFSGKSALDGFPGRHPFNYLAYAIINRRNLHFTNAGCAGRVIETAKIVRHFRSDFDRRRCSARLQPGCGPPGPHYLVLFSPACRRWILQTPCSPHFRLRAQAGRSIFCLSAGGRQPGQAPVADS